MAKDDRTEEEKVVDKLGAEQLRLAQSRLAAESGSNADDAQKWRDHVAAENEKAAAAKEAGEKHDKTIPGGRYLRADGETWQNAWGQEITEDGELVNDFDQPKTAAEPRF